MVVDDTEVSKEDNANKKELEKSVTVNRKPTTQNTNKTEETEELLAKRPVKIPGFSSYVKAGGFKVASLVLLTNLLFALSIFTFDLGLGVW